MALERLKQLAQRLRFGPPEPMSPWGSPVTLDRGLLGEASMDLDGQGRGVALWENSGQLWTMPIGPRSRPAMVRLPMGEGTTPIIVLNAQGRGLALWLSGTAGERQILGSPQGGAEQGTSALFRTDGQVHHLQAAVDRRGNALVVWLLDEGGPIGVMAQAFDARRQAWEEAPTTLGFAPTSHAVPRIALNHREHAMVLWEVDGGPSSELVASHYWPADRIWSDRPVPVVAHSARLHQVVMDDLGNALALWVHAPYGQRCTLEASYYDGQCSEWGTPEVLSAAQTISSLRLVMSGEGEALAAWCQAEGHGASRLLTKPFRKGRWETGTECLELGHEPVRAFAIDVGPGGQAGLLAVHQGPEGDWVSGRLRQRDGWSPSYPLAQTFPQSCASPRLRLCPHGASALWFQGTGSKRALMLVETG